MMMSKTWLGTMLAAAIVATSPGAAVADSEPIVVSGRADDGADSRTAALDDAFGAAVRQATAPRLPARLSSEQRRGLEAHVYRRARRFIASYKLLDERNSGGQIVVQIRARIADDTLNEVLESLGIRPAVADSPQPSPTPTIAPRPVLAVFSSVGDEGRSEATAAILTELGFTTKVIDDRGSSWPSDSEALAFMKQAGAGAGVFVEINAVDDGPVRGTAMMGAVATSKVRVLDVTGAVVAESSARRASYGRTFQLARSRAGAEAGREALEQAARAMSERWPAPVALGPGLTIVIQGARSARTLAALERHLAESRAQLDIRGRVTTPNTVQWSVDTSLSAGRVAALLRSARLEGSITANPRGDDRIEVRISESSGS